MSTPIAVINLRKEPAYRREAFEKGLRRLGYVIGVSNPRNPTVPSGPDDLLVIWNKKAGREEEDANLWEKRGGTVIVTENAYLQKVDKTAYAISTHGHNGSGWFPFGHDARFNKLGYAIKDTRPGLGKSLVCGQRGIGSKLMASPPAWAEKKVKELARDGIKARLRSHPGNFAPKVPLLKDLEDVDTCFIWSSSAGVVALLEGILVYHDAPHWICDLWQAHDVPTAMHRMAHGQWHHEEIATGEPFARMKAENWGPRTWA